MRSLTDLPVLLLVIFLGSAGISQAVNQSSQLLPVPGTGRLGLASTKSFSFIVAGDSRPAKADLPQPSTARQIFAAARKHKPAFIVWTGDTIFGLNSADPAVIGQEYQAFFQLAREAGVPVFAAPGNHEMDVKIPIAGGAVKEVGSAQMEALYRTNRRVATDAPGN